MLSFTVETLWVDTRADRKCVLTSSDDKEELLVSEFLTQGFRDQNSSYQLCQSSVLVSWTGPTAPDWVLFLFRTTSGWEKVNPPPPLWAAATVCKYKVQRSSYFYMDSQSIRAHYSDVTTGSKDWNRKRVLSLTNLRPFNSPLSCREGVKGHGEEVDASCVWIWMF